MTDDRNLDNSAPASRPKRRGRRIAIGVVIALAVIALAVFVIVPAAGRFFTAQETAVRSDWSVETGDLLTSDETNRVNVHTADLHSDLMVVQLVPEEIEDEGFTYYNVDVQDRLAQTIEGIKSLDVAWTASNPLAVLNPYGTGSNSLYLYFETDLDTRVTYTIHVDDPAIADYTATAKNWAEGSEDAVYATEHEFQIVGLVPGRTNEVTLTIEGSFGIERQRVSFTVDMPDTKSGYAVQLPVTEGESTAELSDGLFAMVRTNGYLGYGFFFDNDGIMRYELVTEGLGLDRILYYGNDIVVCSSAGSIARIDGLGRVKTVCNLGSYVLHHDINYCGDNSLVALVERAGAETVEDVVIEVNLDTGEVTELLDFTTFMDDYVQAYTHVIGATDTFFWQAGERDWIHLNTVDYRAEDDALIVSSRETSTIMKVSNVHTSPQIDYFIGNESFWAGTPYEAYSLTKLGDFKYQYGQHSVELDGEGPTEGTYYLLMYDNNYWALSTRSGYSPDLTGTDVSTDLYNGTASYVYRYLVDENAGTYELVDSFAVPYSSIVSNVAHTPDSTNYVVNSGIANVYGEYDESGALIREFAYECTLQSYRTFKEDMLGFWFSEPRR
jgi:arylsulfate sulfotransferase